MRTSILVTFVITITTAASAQDRLRVFPPPEFDHEYDGEIIMTMARSQEEVRRLCPGMTFNLGVALGCAYKRGPRTCEIVIANADVIGAVGHDPLTVLRHERAHCNSWPAHHPGARTIEEAGPRPGAK